MTAILGLRIRHLSFLGPNRAPATVHFGPGFNVLYGASDTGKSFVVDAIDFMLGGKGPLRDIPERVGYDRILLGLENLNGKTYTIHRSMAGGSFTLFDGLHADAMPTDKGIELHEAHRDNRDDNLSRFLLSEIGLVDKRIRRNKANDTNSLSFRNVVRLAIVDEEEIIQKRSPLSDGNLVADTANTSTFKLLITGVDDSSLTSSTRATAVEHSRVGQLELLDQLIAEQQAQIRELSGPPKELEDQDSRLEKTLQSHAVQLATTETQYREASAKRRDFRKRRQDAEERLVEIQVLLERFALLQQHYGSDVERLKGIEEAGTLFSSLGDGTCPLCGAEPAHQHKSDSCEGNPEEVVLAAQAELGKIVLLQADLSKTIDQLAKESRSLQRRLPNLEGNIAELSTFIESQIAPNLRSMRQSYSELADKRAEVREALGIFRALKDLQDRKVILEAEVKNSGGDPADSDLPSSSVHLFSTVVLGLLKEWHFPNLHSVHFDQRQRDLVIDGKNRTSFGKGLRAITQSAFSIGLLEYCRQQATPHPGFVILDSPLLSYKEPDGEDDDLRHTDLKQRFYHFLQALPQNQQVIIVENTDPPADVQALPQAVKFTGNPGDGRAGLFVITTSDPSATAR
uniref:Rad50/SbcC-type AAA domain-containing protein n=1 Tax=Rhodopseudomonas palustris (strain BisA53) TaxID=316055 RepID=Q07SU8_RHOP5